MRLEAGRKEIRTSLARKMGKGREKQRREPEREGERHR